MSTTGERWKYVEGFRAYEVSNHGRVRNIDTGRVLHPRRTRYGHQTVALYQDGVANFRYVHRLVAETFLANPDGLPVVRHLNDIPYQNNVSNLAWGTSGQNYWDAIENDRIVHPVRTHCPKGHALDGDNVYLDRGRRVCRTCKKESVAKSYRKRKELSIVN